jgi:hypothetical protein
VLGTIANFVPQTRKERYLGAYGAYAQPAPKQSTRKKRAAAAARGGANAQPVNLESIIRGQ